MICVKPSDLILTTGYLWGATGCGQKFSLFKFKTELSTVEGRVLNAVEYGIPSYKAFSIAASTDS